MVATQLTLAESEQEPHAVAFDPAEWAELEALCRATGRHAEDVLRIIVGRLSRWVPGSGFNAVVQMIVDAVEGDIVPDGPLSCECGPREEEVHAFAVR